MALRYLFFTLLFSVSYLSYTCTRIVYTGDKGLVISGRTMDWINDTSPNIYLFPRGMIRSGEVGDNSIQWVSKYGSIVTAADGAFTSDGMNEKGLMFSVLYLKETSYLRDNDNRKGISVGAWGQYVLDSFATVEEAVNELSKDGLRVNDPIDSKLHFAISDSTGNSAIIEYIEGNIKIYQGREHCVLTNSPKYDIQFENQSNRNDSLTSLPGGIGSQDRFARASFYVNAIPKTGNANEGVMSVFSVLRTLSTPLHNSPNPDELPFYTVWRSVADQRNKVYYFEMTSSPNIFWIEIDRLNFEKGADVKKLTLNNGLIYSGSATDMFEKSYPFKFIQ